MGTFVNNYHGVAMTTTNEAWADEIHIMQEVLIPWKDEDGQVISSTTFHDSESELMSSCYFVGLSSALSSKSENERCFNRISNRFWIMPSI